MFSPMVSAPLTCGALSGSSAYFSSSCVGTKALYCSMSAFVRFSKLALSSAVHQSLSTPSPSYCAPWSSKPWPIS